MGVDEGAILSDRKFAGADVLATSYTLSQGIKKLGNSDLIICGKQTTDGDTAQVGPEIAEFLNILHITNVTKIIEIKDKSIVVECDMPNILEECEINYPCLITVEKGIYEPRLSSFKLKLDTKNREIPMYRLSDFENQDENNYGLNGSPTQVLRIFPPASNNEKEVLRGSSEEISEKLANKLKELKLKESFDCMYEKSRELRGQVSGEHGIGYAKKEYLHESQSEPYMDLIKSIKIAFDHKNILNPSKIY